jgi:hypothetical protein
VYALRWRYDFAGLTIGVRELLSDVGPRWPAALMFGVKGVPGQISELGRLSSHAGLIPDRAARRTGATPEKHILVVRGAPQIS